MDGERRESPERLADHEPFLTMREYPFRFWIGVPFFFFGGILAGFAFVERSLSLAVAVQLAVQTGGFLWLYVPVARRRWKEEARAEDRHPGDAAPEGGSDSERA